MDPEMTSELVDLIKRGPHVDASSLVEVMRITPYNTATTILRLSLMAYDAVQRGTLVEKE